jgi:hypothetical protein
MRAQELQREGQENLQRLMDRQQEQRLEYQREQNENWQNSLDRNSELYGNGAY